MVMINEINTHKLKTLLNLRNFENELGDQRPQVIERPIPGKLSSRRPKATWRQPAILTFVLIIAP